MGATSSRPPPPPAAEAKPVLGMSDAERKELDVRHLADLNVVREVMKGWETTIPFLARVGNFSWEKKPYYEVSFCIKAKDLTKFRDPKEARCILIRTTLRHVRECDAWIRKQNLVLPHGTPIAVEPLYHMIFNGGSVEFRYS
jgi:hypothetical protein